MLRLRNQQRARSNGQRVYGKRLWRLLLGTHCPLLIALMLTTVPTRAATITAATCSQSDVQNAINSANNGDTVVVEGGSGCTWSLSLSKPITLACASGATCSIAGSISITPAANVSTRLTGFAFTSAGALNINGSPATAVLRVDHNSFTGGGTMVGICCNTSILFDHNTVSGGGADEMIHHWGGSAGVYTGQWTNDVIPASPYMAYLEDNTFTNNSGTVNNAIQNYYGARVVFRHNILTANVQIDVHGSTLYNTRWWEIYENTFAVDQCPTNSSICGLQTSYADLRGGSGVFFNNHLSGSLTQGTPGVQVRTDIGGTCLPASDYPACGQIGRGVNTASASCSNGSPSTNKEFYSPAYFWGNDASIQNSIGNSGCTIVQANRDYFVSSSQPSSLLKCESSNDSGTTSSCSTTYNYTPFAYPYPLDVNGIPAPAGGASGVDTTPPSAPTGLSALATSSSQINLTWTGSTDNIGVAGYKVFRNGSQIGTAPSTAYADTGLAASTPYTYTVAAFDAAGNTSAQSASASATTQSVSGSGNRITAPSCSASAVQSAINSAKDGDTVLIAASMHPCTITGNLTMSKGITFDGGGDTSMTANIALTPDTAASARITGFLFDGNTSRITVGTQGSLVPPTVKPFRIDHNEWGTSTLNGPSGVDIEIWGRAGLTALIDNNIMYAGSAGNGALSGYGPEPIHNFGGVNQCSPGNCNDTWQDQTGWHTPVTPGSGNAIYVEHNTINDVMTSVNGCSWIEAYSGAVTVARYNTITNCAFDEHGTAGMVGARWWELYENTYFIPSSGFAYSDIRAGSGLIFHNHMALGSATGKPWQIREEDTSETYAACYQIGRGFDPTPSASSVNPGWQSCTKDDPSYFGTSVNPEYFSPAYFWGNDAGMENTIYIPAGSIQLGRDIMCWDGTKWSGTCGNTSDPSPVMIHRCQDGTEAGCSATTTSTAAYLYTPFSYPYPVDANGMPNPSGSGSNPPPNLCDINGDGQVNIADVQQEINMALGKATCTNPSGSCNVTSVQKVINAALGGTCVTP